METLQCHPVLLSGGFPLPSGYADRLWDVSYLLFSATPFPVSVCMLRAPPRQPSILQSQPLPGEHSLQPGSWGEQPCLPEMVYCLQKMPVCTCLHPLLGQIGSEH